jgi:hypothetical protein
LWCCSKMRETLLLPTRPQSPEQKFEFEFERRGLLEEEEQTAHFAAESSKDINVDVCPTDDFTQSVDALVYYIDHDKEEKCKGVDSEFEKKSMLT